MACHDCGEGSARDIALSPAGETWVEVGRIGKAFGLKGEVVIHYFGDGPDRFIPGAQVFIVTPHGRVAAEVSSARQLTKKLVVAFAGRTSIEAIAGWVGSVVQVPAATLPVLAPGSWYHYQLVGLEVYRADGRRLGVLEKILATGGNDVFCVRDGGREVLIPAISEAVERVDLEAGRIVLKDVGGLIES